MNRPASNFAWAALAVLGTAIAARADTLTLTDGREMSVTVTGIASGLVATARGEAVPVAQVRRIRPAKPDVIPYPSGIWLTDGTLLGGTVRDLKPGALTFRSVLCGELAIPMDRVALIYFDGPPAPATLAAPSNGLVRALFKNGGFKDGRLLAVATEHALLRLDSGLEKLPIANLTCLVRAVPAVVAEVTLRNGDRLARVAWSGARGTADAGAGPVAVTLEQVREIVFEQTAQ